MRSSIRQRLATLGSVTLANGGGTHPRDLDGRWQSCRDHNGREPHATGRPNTHRCRGCYADIGWERKSIGHHQDRWSSDAQRRNRLHHYFGRGCEPQFVRSAGGGGHYGEHDRHHHLICGRANSSGRDQLVQCIELFRKLRASDDCCTGLHRVYARHLQSDPKCLGELECWPDLERHGSGWHGRYTGQYYADECGEQLQHGQLHRWEYCVAGGECSDNRGR